MLQIPRLLIVTLFFFSMPAPRNSQNLQIHKCMLILHVVSWIVACQWIFPLVAR